MGLHPWAQRHGLAERGMVMLGLDQAWIRRKSSTRLLAIVPSLPLNCIRTDGQLAKELEQLRDRRVRAGGAHRATECAYDGDLSSNRREQPSVQGRGYHKAEGGSGHLVLVSRSRPSRATDTGLPGCLQGRPPGNVEHARGRMLGLQRPWWPAASTDLKWTAAESGGDHPRRRCTVSRGPASPPLRPRAPPARKPSPSSRNSSP